MSNVKQKHTESIQSEVKTTDQEAKKCGFVSLLGIPNAGKSTLINRLVGQKIAAVTHKQQTTRSPIRGILNIENSQIIFVDTPGVFNPKRMLEKAMVKAAWQNAKQSDITLLVIDARRGLDEAQGDMIQRLLKRKVPKTSLFFALNKIDITPEAKLLALIQTLQDQGFQDNIFPICARTGRGLDRLKHYLAQVMPPSVWLFPENTVSDQADAFQMAEITRESILILVHEEIPYQLTVETDRMEVRKDGSVVVHQTIIVTRSGHKRIVIGHKGEKIKAIGERSRMQLERLLHKRIHLILFVRVEPNWEAKKEHYESAGLEFR